MGMYLIKEHRAELNLDYDTAICCAVDTGSIDLVAYLLDKGANVDAKDGEPLSLAVSKGDMAMGMYLVEEKDAEIHAYEDQALYKAIRRKCIALVAYLLGKGADSKARDGELLQMACSKGNDAMVSLLESYASPPEIW